MQTRTARLVVAVFLLIVGCVAGYLTDRSQRETDRLLLSHEFLTDQLAHLQQSLDQLGAVQRTYVISGQEEQSWYERGTQLMRDLRETMTDLEPRLDRVAAEESARQFVASVETVAQVDARIREALWREDAASAAMLAVREGDAARVAAGTLLKAIDRRERAALDVARADQARRMWTVLGSAAALWTFGLVLLVRIPRRADAQAQSDDRGTRAIRAPDEPRATSAREASAAIDLKAAADVCVAMSRLSSASALPDVLAGAARVLDTAGIIVWMGAGEELFPVSGCGYDARVLARLEPIGRHATNATAAAWRAGEVRTVAGDAVDAGAIIAPMFGPGGCIGVVTAEMRHGREQDATGHAVIAMFAAQLSAVVSAWPAPSVGGAATEVAVERRLAARH